MTNPLSHVGQTPRPEISEEVEQHCEQVQSQQQQQSGQSQSQKTSVSLSDHETPDTEQRPATRLAQHPRQDQGDASEEPGEQLRIRQQGKTRAEDTALPSPSQAD